MGVKLQPHAKSTSMKSGKISSMDRAFGEDTSGPRASGTDPEHPEFVRFAQRRGFDPVWLGELGLGLAAPEAVDFTGLWCAIPYTHLSGKWYDRYRRIDYEGHGPKYLSPSGATVRLYNPLNVGPNVDYVWFCEGEFNALTLISGDIPAVAIGGAENWKPHWTTMFESATVIVGYDNDHAGQKNAVMTANQFRNAVIFDRYPEHINDFNEWMMEDSDSMWETVGAFMSKHGVG